LAADASRQSNAAANKGSEGFITAPFRRRPGREQIAAEQVNPALWTRITRPDIGWMKETPANDA
jgi:hypothetical protein